MVQCYRFIEHVWKDSWNSGSSILTSEARVLLKSTPIKYVPHTQYALGTHGNS